MQLTLKVRGQQITPARVGRASGQRIVLVNDGDLRGMTREHIERSAGA